MSRSKIAGLLPFCATGESGRSLSEFELEGNALEFTLEVPLSAQLLGGLTRTNRPLPDDGDLTFRLSNLLLDIRNAVGVVPIVNLRSRLK